MRKLLIEGSAIILLFFSLWSALAKIDWMAHFKVQKVADKTEEKLGDILLDVFKQTHSAYIEREVIMPIDSIVSHMAKANGIDRHLIKLHILRSAEINAFALPDGHLIVYSGLINNTENQEELAGVIAHEIAHITSRHVMRKLVKEFGLSILISMTTGNTGTEVIKESARLLSSTAFDRSLEREADIKAVDYLVKAKVDPVPFADFLYKLAQTEPEASKYITWVSTHPETKERAEYIMEHSNTVRTTYKPVLSTETWDQLKRRVEPN